MTVWSLDQRRSHSAHDRTACESPFFHWWDDGGSDRDEPTALRRGTPREDQPGPSGESRHGSQQPRCKKFRHFCHVCLSVNGYLVFLALEKESAVQMSESPQRQSHYFNWNITFTKSSFSPLSGQRGISNETILCSTADYTEKGRNHLFFYDERRDSPSFGRSDVYIKHNILWVFKNQCRCLKMLTELKVIILSELSPLKMKLGCVWRLN